MILPSFILAASEVHTLPEVYCTYMKDGGGGGGGGGIFYILYVVCSSE